MGRLSPLLAAFAVFTAIASGCQCSHPPPPKETGRPEGDPCDKDSQCLTGLCESVLNGPSKCIRPCSVGCHELEVCEPLNLRYGCVPEKAGLCKECEKDADCPYPGDHCLVLGAEKLCGRDCGFDAKSCPSSYRCGDATTVTGEGVSTQCQPTSGTCACTTASTGQSVPCEAKNTVGTCLGVKTCNPPSGYGACTAQTPAAEVCNGKDDDCDGQIDEDLGDLHCGVGECARAAAACANGTPQVCTPGAPSVERCDGKDNDCDGVVDNGIDLKTDVGNCGSCGFACVVTNAVPRCELGVCGILHCLPGFTDRDGVAANGCEYTCTPTDGGFEVCDGIDNDCNGIIDDGFNLTSDPTNCGQCGLTCNVANGTVSTYACVARVCGINQCVAGRGDCNQVYPDGCETNLLSDLSNCGGCGKACAPAHATPACTAGVCSIAACAPGFKDCNAMLVDGCEINTNADVDNCGACGHVCSAANATSNCTGGTCGFTCLANWWNADNNAANGCEYACVKTNNGVEACDNIDNDCDGLIDEDFNVSSDVNNCGLCGNHCSAPFASSLACSSGACSLVSCQALRGDCNGAYVDGCETNLATDPTHCGACNLACAATNASTYSCNGGNCGVATCQNGYANCDGLYSNGCEVNTNTSLSSCGSCGAACTVANGTPVCTTGSCQVQSCNPGFNNCNNQPADGCEINTGSDPNNCGSCGHVCSYTGANATCTGGSCAFSCQPGHYDLDGNPANGCEYTCNYLSAIDLPDLGFVDANCDGIDGEINNGIFVAATGNDSNAGTMAFPKRTLTSALTAAVGGNKRDVYVAAGTYVEMVSMSAGKGLYGAYQLGSWQRALANTVTVTGTSPALIINNANNTSVQLVSFIGANVAAGNSAYGAMVLNSTNVSLEQVSVRAGNGGGGADGLPGVAGSSGSNGLQGGQGVEHSSGLFCNNNGVPPGAAGGTSSCGRTGGSGGAPAVGGNWGTTGGAGVGGTPGGPGTPNGQGNWSTPSTYWGWNGADGATGSSGVSGGAFGTAGSLGYVVALATSGAVGGHGNGGGGGGGGGGGTTNCDSSGGAGSGGGAGGCAGTAGSAGTSGGASIAVYLYNSAVGSTGCSFSTGSGGNGGSGGAGSAGGTGGVGGPINPYGGSGEQDDGSNGGRGGNGGNGGSGGWGGAGGGGPSIGVLRAGGSVWTETSTSYVLGSAGSGGFSAAGVGATGVRTNIY